MEFAGAATNGYARGETGERYIERLEQQQKLTSNQWKLICTANVANLLDFFDFFLMVTSLPP